MKNITLRKYIPKYIQAKLFGDREKFGLRLQSSDSCWKAWEDVYWDFFHKVNDQFIARQVKLACCSVLSRVDLSDKKVLELGPGDINHMPYWRGFPSLYTIIDIRQSSIDLAIAKLKSHNINYESRLLPIEGREEAIFGNEDFDIIILIATLEHLYPLRGYLERMIKALKKRGKIVGSIPCEGGLAWGMGRFLTSRRWVRKNTRINFDKIICWEHPNFADDIITALDSMMMRRYLSHWPMSLPSIDFNLVIKFVYEKI